MTSHTAATGYAAPLATSRPMIPEPLGSRPDARREQTGHEGRRRPVSAQAHTPILGAGAEMGLRPPRLPARRATTALGADPGPSSGRRRPGPPEAHNPMSWRRSRDRSPAASGAD